MLEAARVITLALASSLLLLVFLDGRGVSAFPLTSTHSLYFYLDPHNDNCFHETFPPKSVGSVAVASVKGDSSPLKVVVSTPSYVEFTSILYPEEGRDEMGRIWTLSNETEYTVCISRADESYREEYKREMEETQRQIQEQEEVDEGILEIHKYWEGRKHARRTTAHLSQTLVHLEVHWEEDVLSLYPAGKKKAPLGEEDFVHFKKVIKSLRLRLLEIKTQTTYFSFQLGEGIDLGGGLMSIVVFNECLQLVVFVIAYIAQIFVLRSFFSRR